MIFLNIYIFIKIVKIARAADVRTRIERNGDGEVNDLKSTDGINSVPREAFMMLRLMSHKNVCG